MIFSFVIRLWNALVYNMNEISLTQRRIKFVFRQTKCIVSVSLLSQRIESHSALFLCEPQQLKNEIKFAAGPKTYRTE